jgi:LacI family transcriptional regulator
MTLHLQKLGHSEIAFIAGPPSHAAASMRCDGFKAAMADAGMAVRSEWLKEGDFTFRGGLEVGEALINARRRPTAIFAANDDMALGVMVVAHRWRLEIPTALSIVGFDDSPSAQVVWPQLTTVSQPVAEMASAAIEILIDMKGARGELDRSRRLDFELVIRESSGSSPILG